MLMNLDYEPINKAECSPPSWVAVLDIMGYKELVRQASSNATIAETTIGTLSDALRDVTSLWSLVGNEATDISIISDSVCVSWGVCEMPSLGVVNDVSAICLEFLEKGLFLKGSLAFGQHHNDGKVLFSQAFIDAYNGQEDEAFYPRVLCDYSSPDPTLPGYVKSLLVSYTEVDRVNKANGHTIRFDGIWQDCDGRFFINYLSGIDMSGDPHTAHPQSLLMRHKKLISCRLKHFQDEGNRRIAAKYGWLASYHNRFCLSRGMSGDYMIESAPSQRPMIER
ncbi:MAG: hypothetical protein ABFD94_15555 [Armatimonadia bacterium]